jgi:hypothetical protein
MSLTPGFNPVLGPSQQINRFNGFNVSRMQVKPLKRLNR